jgi:hypothetical protein
MGSSIRCTAAAASLDGRFSRTMSSSNLALAELRDGPLYRFGDWPNPAIPNGLVGVYTVWRGDQLIYVGMAGRALSPGADASGPASAKLTGLRSRLAFARVRTPVR